jgi:hypothetical protein
VCGVFFSIKTKEDDEEKGLFVLFLRVEVL